MHRVHVTFSDGTQQVLVEISRRLGRSDTDDAREALSLYWWFVRERSAGTRLLVQRGTEIRELRIPGLDRLGP